MSFSRATSGTGSWPGIWKGIASSSSASSAVTCAALTCASQPSSFLLVYFSMITLLLKLLFLVSGLRLTIFPEEVPGDGSWMSSSVRGLFGAGYCPPENSPLSSWIGRVSSWKMSSGSVAVGDDLLSRSVGLFCPSSVAGSWPGFAGSGLAICWAACCRQEFSYSIIRVNFTAIAHSTFLSSDGSSYSL
jgi:hypothetical protein